MSESADQAKPVFETAIDDIKQCKLNLHDFLSNKVVSKGQSDKKINFISMAPQYRKGFDIPEAAIPQFMNLLNECYKEGVVNSFYEVQDVNEVKASGLFFQFKFESEQRKIEFESVVPGFIRILFSKILTKWIAFSEGTEEHYCFCLSTTNATYDPRTTKFKSTFRITVPSILLDSDARFFIYHLLWQSKDLKALFTKKLHYRFRDCFKRSMRNAPITLIGSREYDEHDAMKLDFIRRVEVENGECDGESVIMTHFEAKFTNIINEASINYPYDGGIVTKGHYLPLSICIQKMEKDTDDAMLFQIAYDDAVADYMARILMDDNLKFTYDILVMLHPDRFKTVDNWLEVMSVLASKPNHFRCLAVMITKDRAKKLITWEQFNMYWPECVSKAKSNKQSSTTLRYWAMCDSPSQMDCYVDQLIQEMMMIDVRDNIIKGKIQTVNVANYAKIMFENTYVTINGSKNAMTWYEFVTPASRSVAPGQLYKWRKLDGSPYSISEFISCRLKDIADKVKLNLMGLVSQLQKTSEKGNPLLKRAIDISNNFDMHIIAILRTSFKTSVITEMSMMFNDSYFIEQLDQDEHLLGVGNGVVLFNNEKVTLLDNYHSYPVSLFTDTNYIPYDENNYYIKEIYKVLRSFVPEDEMDALDFILYYLSTSLDAIKNESLFLIVHGGGCHARDTPIRMFDGSLKMVQDVSVGDKIMGDDNTARNVQELFRGTDDMVRILPIKGESFEVNKDHVLSLKFTGVGCVYKRADGIYQESPKYRAEWYELNGAEQPQRKNKTCNTKEEARAYLNLMLLDNPEAIKKGDIIDIKVKDLMKWSKWWLKKSNVSLYRSNGVAYSEKTLNVDPYMFGYWLSDGLSHRLDCTTEDFEVVDRFRQKLPTGYDVISNKHIPDDYKLSSVEQRLELLAGILDADGHYQASMKQFELSQMNERLFDDCAELVRSLGFACYKAKESKACTNSRNGRVTGTYYRMQIYGEGLETIPCKIARKQASPRTKTKDALLNGFTIEEVGKGDYYGFELDGNHRYLTGDFYVHHNSNGKSVLMELFRRTLGQNYVRKMPLSFVTDVSRTKSASADPATMELKTARLVYYSESDKNEKVNVAKVKELTGGETISARQLFGAQQNFEVKCNHIVMTNHRFVIETPEHAAWRRFLSYRFKMLFKFNHDPNEPLEREKDPKLIALITNNKEYREAFLSILIHYRSMLYSRYDGQILKVPHPTISRETEEYRCAEDVIQRYVMQYVYFYKGRDQSLDELVDNFKIRYKEENSCDYKSKKIDLIHEFRNSVLQKHVSQISGGMYKLKDLYTCGRGEQPLEGSILFADWIKQKMNKSNECFS